MKTIASSLIVVVLALGAAALVAGLGAQPKTAAIPTPAPATGSKPSIVLVHGAFADASGWTEVIKLLQADGYDVSAVQHQVASLTDDVATTRRVIEAQKGPVVVVGHSYGGAVMTGAAVGIPNVKALVYIAAFAPDANEALGELIAKAPPSMLATSLVPDSAGFLYIDRAKFHDVFCKDLPDADARVMAVTQKPAGGPIFGQHVSEAAWKGVPSWYMVAQEDQAINPDLERLMAKRMSAKVTEVKASHLVFISQPRQVVKMIEEAAGSVH